MPRSLSETQQFVHIAISRIPNSVGSVLHALVIHCGPPLHCCDGVLIRLFWNSTLGCYSGFHGNLDIKEGFLLIQKKMCTTNCHLKINFWEHYFKDD